MRNLNLSTCIILLCALLLASCLSPEEKKERYYLKAVEYLKKQDTQSAIIELKNAIKLDAKYAAARYQLGLIYLEQNDQKNAVEELSRAADLDQNNIDANLKTAEIYLIGRKKDKTRNYIGRVLEIEPNNEEALILSANLELIEGNFDKAQEAADKIGESTDNPARLLNIKGRILAARQKWSEAEQFFKQAIAQDPEHLNNYQTLLLLYSNRKELDKATRLLREMVEKFPNNPQPHLHLAALYRADNKRDMTEAELVKAIEIAPEVETFRLLLADFYLSGNDEENTEKTLLKAIEAIPDSQNSKAALATFYFDRRSYEKAEKLLQEIAADSPDQRGVRLLQARFLLKDGKSRDGIDALQKLTNDFPRWADPSYHLGLAHLSLGEVELAAQAIGKAIDLNTQNDKYHTVMAQIFLLKSEFENAEKEAVLALKLNAKNIRAALIIGRSMLGAKKYEDAVKLFENMIAQIPDQPELLDNLARAYLGVNQKDKAEETLVELLELQPDNSRAAAMFASIKYKDDLAGAESFVKAQIENSPHSSGLHLLLGDVLIRRKNNEAALAAFRRARQLDPDNLQAYIASGRVLYAMGKQDEALADYQAMVEQEPRSIPGRMGIATLMEATGKHAEAKEQYQKILEIKGDYPAAANNLAWLIATEPNADLGEALRLAMLAKQALPEDPNIADTLGWIHYQRTSYSLAIPQFELALNSQPDEPTIAYHLALALSADEQKDAAAEVLQKLLARNVDFPDKEKAAALLAEIEAQ